MATSHHPSAKNYILEQFEALKANPPLVVNITNYVVMNNTANALLAIGASPIMAHSRLEMAELMKIAGALVINIGTLDSTWIERMRFAIEQANANQVPVVLDPVGCGASDIRTQTSREFAQLAERLIIRCNASEVIALAGEAAGTKGVDATNSIDEALTHARHVAKTYQANVVISGERDLLINPMGEFHIANGSPMMAKVTGMGCSHTALTAAFAAIGDDTGLASTAILGICGQIAVEKSAGPGSLQLNLLDELYQLDSQKIAAHLAVEALA
ncbi:MAG: hydroxyethylthiazole kinase [Vibrio sp.]